MTLNKKYYFVVSGHQWLTVRVFISSPSKSKGNLSHVNSPRISAVLPKVQNFICVQTLKAVVWRIVSE